MRRSGGVGGSACKPTQSESFNGNSICCLCKRPSRQTTLVCVNAPRRNKRLPLPLHLAVEITDTCSPSLYISLLLAQIDNINHSFLCALWLCSSHEKQYLNGFKSLNIQRLQYSNSEYSNFDWMAFNIHSSIDHYGGVWPVHSGLYHFATKDTPCCDSAYHMRYIVFVPRLCYSRL
jgi:hypothetical protein